MADLLAEPCEGFTRCDAHQDLVFMQVILDLVDHCFVLLRLHAEEHDITLSGDEGVVGGGLDAEAFMRCVRMFER